MLGHRRHLGLSPGQLRAVAPGGQEEGTAIDKAGGDVVVGDCHLANGGIVQETGRTPQHPLSTMVRAYGIPED